MSERGSFVTQYIYCDRCLEAAKAVLLGNGKYLCSRVLPSWEGQERDLPIIAGKLGGLYAGEELETFELELGAKLANLLCHPMRIAILCDHEEASQIFMLRPEGSIVP